MSRLLPLLLLAACSRPFAGQAQDGDRAQAHPQGEIGHAPAAFARLTTRQYRNVLDDLFGAVVPVALQEDTYPYLFATVGASTEPLSEQGVQLLEEAATAITDAVFADPVQRRELVGCSPASMQDACVADYLARFGRQAYRRPLTDTERARWLAVGSTLAEGDPWLGLQAATAGILQSPYVLYRVELGSPLPDDPSLRQLNDFELASRLSFLLWNTGPDAILLDAAEAGRLSTTEGLAEQARRLLDDERSRDAIEAFFAQYLDLSRLDRAAPDAATYPRFTETLRGAMRDEVLLLVDEKVNRQDSDVRAIFSERRAFVNSELALHYGLRVDGVSPITFVPVDLPPDSERAGILGLGAFLTMNAHAIDTSPTLRGKYILERVLCAVVPPPPDSVNLDLSSESGEATTLRERLDQHREDPACAGCHALMDPPGFLFEHFDPTGAWRDLENGQPVDSSGDLSGVPLSGSGALGDLLATDPRVGPCMVKQLFRHGHGRLDQAEDRASLEQLSAAFEDSGYRFRALLLALVTHESFRVVAAPEDAP